MHLFLRQSFSQNAQYLQMYYTHILTHSHTHTHTHTHSPCGIWWTWWRSPAGSSRRRVGSQSGKRWVWRAEWETGNSGRRRMNAGVSVQRLSWGERRNWRHKQEFTRQTHTLWWLALMYRHDVYVCVCVWCDAMCVFAAPLTGFPVSCGDWGQSRHSWARSARWRDTPSTSQNTGAPRTVAQTTSAQRPLREDAK